MRESHGLAVYEHNSVCRQSAFPTSMSGDELKLEKITPPAPQLNYARVAELVYAFDLKSNPERGMGPTPIPSTKMFSKNKRNTARPRGALSVA